MQYDQPISRYMTHKTFSVAPKDSLEDVRQIFERFGFHHVPVVDGGSLVGIVSYTDYLRVIRDLVSLNGNKDSKGEKMLRALSVEDMMTPDPYSLRPEDTLESAMQVFRDHRFHSLPVTDRNGRLVGMLTTYDVMKAFEKEAVWD
jgi:Mg/Co/Ni transporter MgtE